MIYLEFRDKWTAKEWPEEKKQFVRDNWPGYSEIHAGQFNIPYNAVRATWPEAQIWIEQGFDMEIKPCKSMMLTTMKDQDPEADGVKEFMSGRLFNVTLPDVGLLLIDEVTWIEDACTQELQAMLNQGWRILAVCPPNAQRRPDYILGRRKERAA